jgi:hypothetical protein
MEITFHKIDVSWCLCNIHLTTTELFSICIFIALIAPGDGDRRLYLLDYYCPTLVLKYCRGCCDELVELYINALSGSGGGATVR